MYPRRHGNLTKCVGGGRSAIYGIRLAYTDWYNPKSRCGACVKIRYYFYIVLGAPGSKAANILRDGPLRGRPRLIQLNTFALSVPTTAILFSVLIDGHVITPPILADSLFPDMIASESLFPLKVIRSSEGARRISIFRTK